MPFDLAGYADVRREMESRRAEAIMRADRYAARFRACVWLAALGWYAVGIVLLLLSYHLASSEWAGVAFWAGVTACLGGPFFTWVVGFTVGRDQGIWD